MTSLIINVREALVDFPRAIYPSGGNEYVMPGWYSASTSNNAVTANRIYAFPIFIPQRDSFDRIGIYVQAGDGAGGTADMRIFEHSGGKPGALKLNPGSTVSTNAAGFKEVTISQELARGYYWLAVRCDNTPTLSGPHASYCFFPSHGLESSGAQNSGRYCVLYGDAAYADPCPDLASYANPSWAFVRLRRA